MLLFRFLFCFAFVCLPAWMLAQRSIDSLERVLATKELTDEAKIKLYDELSQGHADNDVNRSLSIGKKGLALAKKSHNERMEATFYRNIGIAHYRGGAHDTAMLYLEKARPIAAKLQEHSLQASIENAYGNIYLIQNQYDKALEHYFYAARILEEQQDVPELIKRYFNIGGVYQTIKNFEQALKYHKLAEKLALQANDQEGLAYVYVSLSDIAVHQGEPKEVAVDYARKAVQIFENLDNKRAGNIAMQALAQAYYFYGDYVTAEPIARKAMLQAKKTGNPHLITEALMTLSNLYFHQGQYDQSRAFAMEMLEIDSTDNYITMNAYTTLAIVNAYLGHPALTQQYVEKYRTVLEKHSNEAYQKSLSGMEVKYETEKKELKIAALERQRQLYIWLGIAGIVILLIALAFAVIRYRLAVNKRKLAEHENRRLEQEKQLVAVQATLEGETAERTRLAKDLHDGLGSMLSLVKFNLPQIRGDAAVLEAVDVSRFQKALGMLDDSIQELRRVAHHMMPEALLRYGFKASLADFCEAIPNVEFHYFGNESRLPEKLEIMIYRCVHELVNNALKHAQATHINVQLVQEPDRISFTVQDDGVGFNEEAVQEGMGLKNVRQRVATFQGELHIYSSDQGTEIHVELKLSGE